MTPVPDRPHRFTPLSSFAHFHRLLWAIRPSTTLGTVPVSAGVIRDVGAVAAPGTTVQVTAECRRAAVLDAMQHSQMLKGQPGAVVLNEAFAVLSNDVRAVATRLETAADLD